MSHAALAYVRDSTAEQAQEGVSLAAQEAKIAAYCTLAGLDLVATAKSCPEVYQIQAQIRSKSVPPFLVTCSDFTRTR